MFLFRIILLLLSLGLASSSAFAKGENEVGLNLSYYDAQSATNDGAVHSTHFTLGGIYLHNFKSYWTGGELAYDSYRADSGSTSLMLFGMPFKYWMKGPDSHGVGFYVYATPYLGRVDEGDGGGTVFGLKTGPALVVFLSDMLGVDIKLMYDYRKTSGRTSTTTGLVAGFSVYF